MTKRKNDDKDHSNQNTSKKPNVQSSEIEHDKTLTNATDPNLCTALHLAASNGNIEALLELLEKATPELINATDKDGATALHLAAQEGHKDVVVLLLNKDPELINAIDNEHWTALHLAASNGHTEALLVLLEEATPELINAKDNNDHTALHFAAMADHKDTIELLLKKSPQLIGDKDIRGMTTLHWAAHTCRTEALKVLLERSTPELIDATDNDGYTALHRAAESKDGNKDIIALLLEKSPQLIDKKVNDDLTVLHLATTNGHKNIIELLLEKSPQLIDDKDKDGFTALHWAAEEGYKDIIELLLEKSPQLIGQKTNDGMTVLHLAAEASHKDTIELLLEKSPQLIGDKDIGGRTALDLVDNENHKTIKVIKSASAAYNLVNNGSYSLSQDLDQDFLLKYYKSYILNSGFIGEERTHIKTLQNNSSIPAPTKESLIKLFTESIESFDLLCATLYHLYDSTMHPAPLYAILSNISSMPTNIESIKPLIKMYQDNHITFSYDLSEFISGTINDSDGLILQKLTHEIHQANIKILQNETLLTRIILNTTDNYKFIAYHLKIDILPQNIKKSLEKIIKDYDAIKNNPMVTVLLEQSDKIVKQNNQLAEQKSLLDKMLQFLQTLPPEADIKIPEELMLQATEEDLQLFGDVAD